MKKGWREWTSSTIYRLSDKNFVISMDFKTKLSTVSLFELFSKKRGGWDRELGLKNGKPYVRVWRGSAW
jgi:hypothetical protein